MVLSLSLGMSFLENVYLLISCCRSTIDAEGLLSWWGDLRLRLELRMRATNLPPVGRVSEAEETIMPSLPLGTSLLKNV